MRKGYLQVTVRPIRGEDFRRLFRIVHRAFSKEMEIGGFDSQRFWRNAKLYKTLETLLPIFEFLHLDLPTILVATLDDKVVGEVHLVPIKRRVWTIDSLAVDPNRAGHGIGSSLIKGSVDYIIEKHGKKALSSIRTDNYSALKIAKKLGFLPFQKTTLFFHEIKNQPYARIPPSVAIRGFQPADAEEVFRVYKVTDPTRTKVYNMSPIDFLTSPLEWVLNRMLQLRSERLVLEVEDRIVGYAHVTYTSQHEAARIESFCLLSKPDFPRITEALLIYILNFLAERNIRKAVASISEKRKETIETFQKLGFKRLASFIEITKTLDQTGK